MKQEKFSEYDMKKLQSSRKELCSVLDYYCGDSQTRKLWMRLETIISKLDELIELAKKEEK